MKKATTICKLFLAAMFSLFMLAACKDDESTVELNPLELEKTVVETGIGYSVEVDILSGNGRYSVTSGSTAVATAAIENETVVITGVSKGPATITVTDDLSGNTKSIEVTVLGLGLSANVQGVALEQSRSFDIMYGTGPYTLSDPSTAGYFTAFLTGSRITIYGTAIGTATITVTDTATGEKLDIPIRVCDLVAIDKADLSLVPEFTETVNITAGSGSYSAESANTAVVTAEVENNVVTITGVSAGSAAINIRDVVTGSQVSASAIVTDNKTTLVFFEGSAGGEQKLMINAARRYRSEVWFDLNGNGIREAAETVTVFEESSPYVPTVLSTAIYGKMTDIGKTQYASHNIQQADFSKNPSIETIDLSLGRMNKFDVTGCTMLRVLNINNGHNLLLSLDVSTNTALKQLSCTELGAEILDVSGLSELELIHCMSSENLKKIILKDNTKLQTLSCFLSYELESIEGLSECENLTFINTYGCSLKNLNLLGCPKLESVWIGANPYTTPISLATNDGCLKELSIYQCNMSNTNAQSLLNSIPDRSKATVVELDLWANKIEQLDLSKFTSVKTIKCYQNQISREKALELMNSLPTRSANDKGSITVVDTAAGAEAEGNVFTKTAVSIAKAKNWTVWSANNSFVEYVGVDD